MSDSTIHRAVVLGGGGPVGVAWELGLAAGLADGGVDLRRADRVVGTSAGSIAGALLTGGDDISALVADIESVFEAAAGDSGIDALPSEGLGAFMQLMFEGAQHRADPAALAAHHLAIGKFALEAATVPEDAFVGSIGTVLAGRPWPSGFACTAVDAATGTFQVWDADSDVPLERAVASSCAVPGIYPPITLKSDRYMDGGVRSPLNADLVAGAGAAVVVSVTALELPPGFDDPTIGALLAHTRAEIDTLRAGGTAVEVIQPDIEFLTISQLGMALMDFSLIAAAAEAGTRLGKAEADRIAAIWG